MSRTAIEQMVEGLGRKVLMVESPLEEALLAVMGKRRTLKSGLLTGQELKHLLPEKWDMHLGLGD